MSMSKRFGSATMIAGAMASAIAFYTLSLHVSAERAEVDRLRGRIAADLRDIRALEAELRTRARLPVLQRWNDDVLAMAAPTSKQFAQSPMQLASFAPGASQPAAAQQPTVQLAVAAPEAALPQMPIVRASYGAAAVQPSSAVTVVIDAKELAALARPAQPDRSIASDHRAEVKKVETAGSESKAQAKKADEKPARKPEAGVRLAEAKPKPVAAKPKASGLDGLDSLAGTIDSAVAAERSGTVKAAMR
jgi:hypothetical protein